MPSDQNKTTPAVAVAVERFADCGPGHWWFVHHPDGYLIELGAQAKAEQLAAEINAGRRALPLRGLVFIEDDGTIREPTNRDI